MNKKYLVILAILAALAVGYFVGTQRAAVPGDPVRAQATAVPISRSLPQSSTQTYILNTNTKKFHKPSCSSVKQMKESNKKAVTWSRQEIINKGYSPCGRCHP